MFALHFPDQTVDPAVRTLRDAGDLFLRKAPAPQIPDDDPQHAFVFLLSKSWRWIILCRNGSATPRCACCFRLDVFLVTGCWMSASNLRVASRLFMPPFVRAAASAWHCS